MNKLYTTLLIACIAVGFTACNDDDCDDLHLGNLANYPNVLKGTFPTEDQVLELGETLEITPELLNPEDATYLMWLDCTDIASDSDELKDFICERSGLYVSSGSAYRSNGGFLRFNIACPQKMLEDGLKRLEKSVKEWKCS